jgi:hypothetical protein
MHLGTAQVEGGGDERRRFRRDPADLVLDGVEDGQQGAGQRLPGVDQGTEAIRQRSWNIDHGIPIRSGASATTIGRPPGLAKREILKGYSLLSNAGVPRGIVIKT